MIAHTSLDYDQIGERTIPQIEAIRLNLPKQVSAKSFGFGYSEVSESEPEPDQEHSVDECMAIAAMFSGFG